MEQVHLPTDAPSRPAWRIVRAWNGNRWRPMLLEAWIRLPDGTWACRLRWYSYAATAGPITSAETFRFDPALIQPLQPDDIRAPGPVTAGPVPTHQRPD